MPHTLIKRLLLCCQLLAMLLYSTAQAAPNTLSATEEKWLSTHHTIHISGPQAFPPFQFVDETGTYQGMASDYVLSIAKMYGLKIEAVTCTSWSEVLQKVKNKEIDLLTCAAKTTEREKFLRFTNPHLSFPLVIISKKNVPFIGGLQDLHNRRIALTKKISTYDWLVSDNIKFYPYFVNNPLEALQEVSVGQADVTIQNLAAASYLIEKNGLANLKIAAPTSYKNYELAIAVRRDLPELADIINKGLASLSREKHAEIRQRWIPVRYEHGIRTADVIKWIALICGTASLFFIAFFMWNRKLAREILQRKRAEAEKEQSITDLTRALQEINTLRSMLPLCSFCKKIRNDEGYWEQVDVYISKHLQADVSHSVCPDCMKEHYAEIAEKISHKKNEL